MGFTDDLWTALLSDESAELDEALDRLSSDRVASDIAAAELGMGQRDTHNKPSTTKGIDAG